MTDTTTIYTRQAFIESGNVLPGEFLMVVGVPGAKRMQHHVIFDYADLAVHVMHLVGQHVNWVYGSEEDLDAISAQLGIALQELMGINDMTRH